MRQDGAVPERPARLVDPDSRVLTDPSAIRALAHPARLTVLEALGEAEEMTATALAALADTTPSAMSYHLRALQKWGFVERAESSDGRERPWRRTVESWRIESMRDPETVEATGMITEITLGRAQAELAHWFRNERTEPAAWRHAALVDNRHAWLTADEAEELRALYERFLEERRGRTAAAHPDGARRVRLVRLLAPTPEG